MGVRRVPVVHVHVKRRFIVLFVFVFSNENWKYGTVDAPAWALWNREERNLTLLLGFTSSYQTLSSLRSFRVTKVVALSGSDITGASSPVLQMDVVQI